MGWPRWLRRWRAKPQPVTRTPITGTAILTTAPATLQATAHVVPKPPWRPWLLWGSASVLASAGLGVLISGGADIRWVPVLFALAVLFALPEICQKTRTRRVASLVTVLCCAFIVSLLSRAMPSPPSPDSLFIDCQHVNPIPVTVMPSGGRLHVMQPLATEETNAGGLIDVMAPPGTKMMGFPFNFGFHTLSRCEIANYGTSTAFNTAISFQVTFTEVIREGAIRKDAAVRSGWDGGVATVADRV
jgi:hypothetical protein